MKTWMNKSMKGNMKGIIHASFTKTHKYVQCVWIHWCEYRFEKLIVNQKTNFVVGKLAYRIKLGEVEA